MQFSGLCPVTLVHKHDKITLGRIIRWQGFLNFFNVLVDILVGCLSAFFTEFMDQRTEQTVVVSIQPSHQIISAFCTDNFLVNALVCLFNLIIKLLAVCDNQYTGIRMIRKNPLG